MLNITDERERYGLKGDAYYVVVLERAVVIESEYYLVYIYIYIIPGIEVLRGHVLPTKLS